MQLIVTDAEEGFDFDQAGPGDARPHVPDLSEERRGELVLDAISALSAALGPLGERSDVLDLDRASSTIGFRVIRDGRCVLCLCRDARDRIRLEASIARRYGDERPYRELFAWRLSLLPSA